MEEFASLVFWFSLYSFLGWVLEVTYCSIVNRKLTYRGFLFGPFCIIYGIGAILILYTATIMNTLLPSTPRAALVIILLLSTILVTILEYIAAVILEKVFAVKLWDYSREAFNLHGRISLKYSLLWGGLAFLLLTFVHPFFERYFLQVPYDIKAPVAFLLLTYLFVDIAFSARKRIVLKQD